MSEQFGNPSVYLISGMAGAGKTTRAMRLESESGAVRFCPDEWLLSLMTDVNDREEMDRLRGPVEALQWQQAQQLLRRGVSVILENGFWSREERLDHAETAHSLGCRVVLIYLDVSKAELWRRISERNDRLAAGALRISERELSTWLGWLESPDEKERSFYDEVVVHTEG